MSSLDAATMVPSSYATTPEMSSTEGTACLSRYDLLAREASCRILEILRDVLPYIDTNILYSHLIKG